MLGYSSMAGNTKGKEGIAYALVANIPSTYHSADLRNYFSQFIETKGFECFHFRHRPESIQVQSVEHEEVGKSSCQKRNSGTCCVVRLQKERLSELIKNYHRKHWLDRNGDLIPQLCFISKIKSPEEHAGDDRYRTRADEKQIPVDREQFTEDDLMKLPELHPPGVMPSGNVGTPTVIFMEFIRQCLLPPKIIKKLGLTFPKTRTNKKYGNVPYDYDGKVFPDTGTNEEEILSASGHALIPEKELPSPLSSPKKGAGHVCDHGADSETLCSGLHVDNGQTKKEKNKKRRKSQKRLMDERIEEKLIAKEKAVSDSEEDADGCEEWERHEAFYNDPSNQERNKERLFEEEIELKWEKGGSGLVFYTDAQYWQAQEGDFDEQTADDYDVDMQGYYEEGMGDKDARDFITLRQEKRRRDGSEETDRFTAGIAKKVSKYSRQKTDFEGDRKIGMFESHTKGFGRKIMEQQGWTEGQGLGSSTKGIAEALDNDGQNPRDKKGLGFRGEKLVRRTGTSQRKVLISTVYDDPSRTDPQEPLLRSNEPYTLKYRDEVIFTKSKDNETG